MHIVGDGRSREDAEPEGEHDNPNLVVQKVYWKTSIDSVEGQSEVYPRIVGGENAEPGSWPWQLALEHFSASSGKWNRRCGAALLSESAVLSAAHCVYGT